MSEKAPQSESAGIKAFEIFTRLIGSLAWPLLILFVFLYLRGQVTQVLSALPKKLSESTKFSLGTLSFEAGQTANATGSADIAKVIEGLSANAVTILLEVGNSSSMFAYSAPGQEEYWFPSKGIFDALNELEQKKMLTFKIPMTEYMKSLAGIALTPALQEARDELMNTNPQISYPAGRKLTQGDVEILQRQSYELTPAGKRAFRLIVDTVTKNLK